MKCGKCDYENTNEAHFCYKCGSNLKNAGTSELEKVRTALKEKYRVISLLGSGNVGSVYLAVDEAINRDVAIKILHEKYSSDSGFSKRFSREMTILAAIDHPNIVPIYTAGTLGKSPYYVMKYIKGETLGETLRKKGKFSEIETIRYARSICDILTHAHDMGIVHRDLKPDNIMLRSDKQDVRDAICIMDFGIAKVTKREEEALSATATITTEDTWTGTPNYMSPEQCRTERNMDGRSDLYSLGIIMYEMLTGKVPFASGNITEVIASHLKDQPAALRSLDKSISEETESLISLLLQKDRKKRPENGHVLNRILEQVENILAERIPINIRENETMLGKIVPEQKYNPESLTQPRIESGNKTSKWISAFYQKIKSPKLRWATIAGGAALAIITAMLVIQFFNRCEYEQFASSLIELEEGILPEYKSTLWQNSRTAWKADVISYAESKNLIELTNKLKFFEQNIIGSAHKNHWMNSYPPARNNWLNDIDRVYKASDVHQLLLTLGRSIEFSSFKNYPDFYYGAWSESLTRNIESLRKNGK